MDRVIEVPAELRARPPDAARPPLTRPRGNGDVDGAVLREGMSRLERVLGS